MSTRVYDQAVLAFRRKAEISDELLAAKRKVAQLEIRLENAELEVAYWEAVRELGEPSEEAVKRRLQANKR